MLKDITSVQVLEGHRLRLRFEDGIEGVVDIATKAYEEYDHARALETAEQQLFLRAAGVHCMQGFRFGRPGAPSEIAARLAAPGVYRSIESEAKARGAARATVSPDFVHEHSSTGI